MPKLKCWAVVEYERDIYLPPKLRRACLQGEVYDHPSDRHEDGKRVCTSPIMITDLKSGLKDRCIQTHNNTYHLEGDPDPEWIEFLQNKDLLDEWKDLL